MCIRDSSRRHAAPRQIRGDHEAGDQRRHHGERAPAEAEVQAPVGEEESDGRRDESRPLRESPALESPQSNRTPPGVHRRDALEQRLSLIHL